MAKELYELLDLEEAKIRTAAGIIASAVADAVAGRFNSLSPDAALIMRYLCLSVAAQVLVEYYLTAGKVDLQATMQDQLRELFDRTDAAAAVRRRKAAANGK